MCERVCKTCEGYRDGVCFKSIPLKSVKGECKEWFPSECPITGMEFNGLVHEEDCGLTAVYGGPYTSWTIPEFDEEYKEFIRRKFDEDEGCWVEGCESLCELEELKEEVSKEKYEEIRKFYNIKD